MAPGIPAEADAWREIQSRVRQSLNVVADADVYGEVIAQANVILHEDVVEPLRKIIGADAEVDRLRVVLDVRQCQLTERRSSRVFEREGSEDRRARLAAEATGIVMDHTSAKAKIVPPVCPGERFG